MEGGAGEISVVDGGVAELSAAGVKFELVLVPAGGSVMAVLVLDDPELDGAGALAAVVDGGATDTPPAGMTGPVKLPPASPAGRHSPFAVVSAPLST